ncbi:hypothetical protein J3A83DRAFT_4107170 [Scleroderma citrinum]
MDSSCVLSDEDYDVISNPGQRSLESSIAWDMTTASGHSPGASEGPALPREIMPTDAARNELSTVSLSPADIQACVRNAIEGAAGTSTGYPSAERTVRVYVDGMFDVLDAGHMLRLRQTKLSFPSTHLIVGVFADDDAGSSCRRTSRYLHVERCEALRHVRWVDQIVPDAPRVLDDAFMREMGIDYVALEEGSSVDPEFERERLRGYDALRKLGRVIPIRRTLGLSVPVPAPVLTSRSATPSCRNTSGVEQEEQHGDVTHGITRLALDGQW